MPAEIPGFIEAMNASGPWEPLPVLITATEPGGAADQTFIEETLERLTMVVCSRRVQCADPAYFESLGLDVGAFASLTVKSRGHFRAGFDEWYPDASITEVDAAGLTSPMRERFPWKALPRPVWPLDPDTQWTPPRLEEL